MTQLLPSNRSTDGPRPPRAPVLVGCLGGGVAALGPLIVAMAIGVVGWFVSDAGTHGRPSSGLRVGAIGWLLGHGSGIDIEGVPITLMPWGITLIVAVVCWRLGIRAGELVADAGPDARALEQGERDLVVPVTLAGFVGTYVIVTLLVALLTRAEGVALTSVVAWAILLSGGIGGLAVAVSSGRAAPWVAALPEEVRDTAVAVGALLLTWLAAAALLLAVGLALGFSEAASVLDRVAAGTGPTILFAALALLLVPNAVLFAAAYALGPGFAVGTSTVVTPSAVALGPVPLFPLVAAVPDAAAPQWLQIALLVLPFVCAVVVTALVQRRRPTPRWDVALARAAASGVISGVLLSLLARLAGGAVGPGRMAQVGPFGGDVLVHAVAAFTTGAVLAAVAMTAWQRRTPEDQ